MEINAGKLMSKKIDFLILGAGPAGLAFANYIMQKGCNSFLVLEKESTAGGLCRSEMVDSAPLDIGGGHFLDTRKAEVNEFLFDFMPVEEWQLFERNSKIKIKESYIDHPLESNIWQMEINDQIEYLKSIAEAGCNRGEKMPEKFTEWIYWKLGRRVAEDYMLPYNRKMFDSELDQLGTYWLEKLPNVSFEETIRSCLTKKAYGNEPAHTQFYYPKRHGYGELWLRMARRLNDKIRYQQDVKAIDIEKKIVITAAEECYEADKIIFSIPWQSIKKWGNLPDKLLDGIRRLKHSAVEVRYFPHTVDSSAQWIYCPDPTLFYHRILVRHNFCEGSKGYWTETNSQRVNMIPQRFSHHFHYMNEYAYPLNTVEKPQIMRELLEYAKEKKVYGLGRWGEHEHYNSDVTVEKAIALAKKLLCI